MQPTKMTRTHEVNGELRTAEFSDCEKYRYTLRIQWNTLVRTPQFMQVIGLNPSTATELVDDPTLRRCKFFARREGCDGLIMTNIFAWRDTDPRLMKKSPAPIGESGQNHLGSFNENDVHLLRTASDAAVIVAAWGNHGAFMNRGRAVAGLISNLKCFKVTGQGHPEHPLYQPSDRPLIPFSYVRKE